MAKPEFSIERAAGLVVAAVLAALFFVQAWSWSAQFHWSSAPWLMLIAGAIVIAGPVALIVLAIVLWKRRK